MKSQIITKSKENIREFERQNAWLQWHTQNANYLLKILIKMVRPISFEDAYPILTLSTHKEPWGSVEASLVLLNKRTMINLTYFPIFVSLLKNNYTHESFHISFSVKKLFKILSFYWRTFYNNLNYIAAKHDGTSP